MVLFSVIHMLIRVLYLIFPKFSRALTFPKWDICFKELWSARDFESPGDEGGNFGSQINSALDDMV